MAPWQGRAGVTVIPENKASEAAAALAVLGYSREEINSTLRGHRPGKACLWSRSSGPPLRGLAANVK